MPGKQTIGLAQLVFDLEARTRAGTRQITGDLNKVRRAQGRMAAESRKAAKAQAAFSKSMVGVGAVAAGVYLAINKIREGIKDAVDEFAKFETAMVGVEKTANLSAAEVEQLGDEITKMAIELPGTTDQFAQLAQLAGQMGIRGVQNISRFTKHVAALASASDLSFDDGARSLARLLNITTAAEAELPNLASALTHVGNTMATTEARVVSMYEDIAASTIRFNLNAKAQLAWAAVAETSGLRAESAATSLSRTFQVFQDAALGDTGVLSNLSGLLDMTSQQVQELAQEDIEGLFIRFLDALNEVPNARAELEKYGLAGERTLKTLTTYMSRTDDLKRTQGEVNSAWADGRAHLTEMEKLLKTHETQMENIGDETDAAKRRIGELFSPALLEAAKRYRDVLVKIADLLEVIRGGGAAVAARDLTNSQITDRINKNLESIAWHQERVALVSKKAHEEGRHFNASELRELEAINDKIFALTSANDAYRELKSRREEQEKANKAAADDPTTGGPGPTGGRTPIDPNLLKAYTQHQRQRRAPALDQILAETKLVNQKRIEQEVEFRKRQAAIWATERTEFTEMMDERADQIEDVTNRLAGAFAKWAVEGGNLKQIMASTLDSIVQGLLRVRLEAQLTEAASGLFGSGGLFGGGSRPIGGYRGAGGRKLTPFNIDTTNQAGGFNYNQGVSLVGETGPELVNLPAGSSVTSASRTRGMMQPVTIVVNNRGGVSTEIEQYVNGAVATGSTEAVKVVFQELNTPGSAARRSVQG